MVKYLNVEQRHIDKANRLRQDPEEHFYASYNCPIVLAVREQIDDSWSGAFSFLRRYATKKGARIGHLFINGFDNKRKTVPTKIRLRKKN